MKVIHAVESKHSEVNDTEPQRHICYFISDALAKKNYKYSGVDDVEDYLYFESYKKGGAVGKSVSDKHRFAKPAGYRWKDKAVQKGVATRADLAHEPSKKMRKKYPNLTYFEDRLNKADAHPTRSSKDSI